MRKILNKSVDELKLDKKIKKVLVEKEIDTVLKLCNHSRLELTDVGLINPQINDVIVSLQLVGLDLKKNHARKNTIVEGYLKS